MILLVSGFLSGVAFCGGALLIWPDLRHRRSSGRSLAARLLPYRTGVGDEVQDWLRRRSP